MIGFLCATPYHIMVAITMATGEFADKKAVLVIMDHAANFNEEFVKKVEGLGIFEKVLLYKSNKKTKLNNIKRLVNAFFVPKLVRDLAKMDFSHFFCLALNFIDAAYLVKRYEKRGINCEVCFADDGIGTYVSKTIYVPKKVSTLILKLNGNMKYLYKIKKLYAYKPELIVVEDRFELVKIVQNSHTASELRRAMGVLWPIDTDIDMGGKILYFEQPYGDTEGGEVVFDEIRLLGLVTKTNGMGACIKMHPRSTYESLWADFDIIKSKIPFEAMLAQIECSPLMYMSNCSTALFSCYFLDTLDSKAPSTVMLNRMLTFPGPDSNKRFAKFTARINECFPEGSIFAPESEDELLKVTAQIYRK